MQSWNYGVSISQADNDYVVRVRDVPEVVTSGDDVAEALDLAADAIETVIGYLMTRGCPLPKPSPVLDGEYPVPVSAPLAAKAAVYDAWLQAKVTKTELARRMGRSETEVRRILDPLHGTKLGQLEEAARALGGRLSISFAAE